MCFFVFKFWFDFFVMLSLFLLALDSVVIVEGFFSLTLFWFELLCNSYSSVSLFSYRRDVLPLKIWL